MRQIAIRACLFDLDNCLAPADAPGPDFLQSLFEAIAAAADGRYDAATLRRIYAECWFQPLDIVARKYSFTPAVRTAVWRAGAALEVRAPMHGYADIGLLATLGVDCFLVTSGFSRLQQSKIDALGIRDWFKAVHVDAIDAATPVGKEAIFRRILREHALEPAEALVIGDNPDSELAAGARVGIRTVQILRPGVVRSVAADHHINRLAELKALLR